MAITEKDVLHVAKLARLDLTAEEIPSLVRDLGSIVEYVATLSEVDTRDVEPTMYVAVEAAPLRIDEVTAGLGPEVGLAEAPRRAEGGFAVPAFMEES